MNAIKKIILFFAIFIIQDKIGAQTSISSSLPLNASDNDSLSEQSVTNKVPNKILTDFELKLTPEQQGYTKFITNDKVFYYKQEGNLKTEYKPNN